MIIPPRIYILIGVFVGILTYGVNLLFGSDILVWALRRQVEANSRNLDFMGTVILEPIIFIFENGIVGAVAAAIVWPLLLIWLVGILCLLVMIAGVDVASDIEEQTDNGLRVLSLL